MTKLDGFLVLTTPYGRIHSTEASVGHLKHPSRHELRQWLVEAGFSVVRLSQWGWPGYLKLRYAANLFPTLIMREFGMDSYGALKVRLNDFVFRVTRWLSLPNTPWGPQFIVIARAV
jgi:hypothetical protein